MSRVSERETLDFNKDSDFQWMKPQNKIAA